MEEHQLIVAIASSLLGIPLLGLLFLRQWYFNLVLSAQAQVRHQDGRIVPSDMPRLLVGHLAEVYQSDNRLAAYHRFHERFGDTIQIFWLWRQQISITNLRSIRQILVTHQQNYRKFPPNRLIQQLYGSSILTNHGKEWQRQRTLMQSLFTPQQVSRFHTIFVTCAEQLVSQWREELQTTGGTLQRDIYPDLTALFIDTISQSAFGIQIDALQGRVDEVVSSICLILENSTHPLYQFIPWWQALPLPLNQKLNHAFKTVDTFLYQLIQTQRDKIQSGVPQSNTLIDLLLQRPEEDSEALSPLSDQEVRDNLLAILINGYETVATSVAFTLDLLARNPTHLQLVQAEVDEVWSDYPQKPIRLTTIPYLNAAIVESLRLCPPMAGLQRISQTPDQLEGWSIPQEQVVGIPLLPLHTNATHYGDRPQQFCPERYWVTKQQSLSNPKTGCPLRRFLGKDNFASVQLPLTFGEGARRCLGATFALHEMAIALGILLHHFDFSIQSGDGAEMELGKFGLFISMRPKQGVQLTIRERSTAKMTETSKLEC